MFIKIEFSEEGVGSFRIHFENDLAEEEIYYSEIVEDVIVSSSKFEDYGLRTVIASAVDFLTKNAYERAADMAVTYTMDEEGLLDDTNAI